VLLLLLSSCSLLRARLLCSRDTATSVRPRFFPVLDRLNLHPINVCIWVLSFFILFVQLALDVEQGDKLEITGATGVGYDISEGYLGLWTAMSQMDQKAPQPGQNMNMNMNNMGGMVGGAPGMEHGAAPRGSSAAAYDGRQMLNTYIYDYFCKNNMFECALALLKSPDAEVQIDGNFRPSPSRRPQKHESDGGMNGIDDESMDGSDGQRQGDDSDDIKNIKDLPPAKVPTAISGSFLLEWWCCFMDIYWARAKGNASVAANAYVSQTQVCAPTAIEWRERDVSCTEY
jgi:hypothetical protein